jgi:hypothetical protein
VQHLGFMFYDRCMVFGSLAQLVEQRTFNPLVAGSNPARPTKIYQEAHELRFVGFFVSGRSLVRYARTVYSIRVHVAQPFFDRYLSCIELLKAI